MAASAGEGGTGGNAGAGGQPSTGGAGGASGGAGGVSGGGTAGITTIMERGPGVPTINPVYFPNTPAASFWSSSLGSSSSVARSVSFADGSTNTDSIDSMNYVGCVR